MKRKKYLVLIGNVCLLLMLVMPFGSVFSEELPKVEWRMQNVYPPPEEVMGFRSLYGRGGDICERVKKRTNGKFVIENFPANALFKGLQCFEPLSKGAIDAVLGYGGYWRGSVPEADFENPLPYSFRSYEEQWNFIKNPEVIKILRHAYAKKNVYWIGPMFASEKTWMTNFPIRSVEDLKGKKIRAVALEAEMVNALGGAATVVSGAEQYTALQRGTVNGTIYVPYTGITYKLFEVVKFITMPWICLGQQQIIVNLDSWNSLPKEYQDILVEEVWAQADEDVHVTLPKYDSRVREEAPKWEVQYIDITPEEWNKFQSYCVPIWEKVGKKSEGCAQLLKVVKKNLSK
jgi:TRAP-type transport system periplasmic protein